MIPAQYRPLPARYDARQSCADGPAVGCVASPTVAPDVVWSAEAPQGRPTEALISASTSTPLGMDASGGGVGDGQARGSPSVGVGDAAATDPMLGEGMSRATSRAEEDVDETLTIDAERDEPA